MTHIIYKKTIFSCIADTYYEFNYDEFMECTENSSTIDKEEYEYVLDTMYNKYGDVYDVDDNLIHI